RKSTRHGCSGVPLRVRPGMSTGRAPSAGIPAYSTTALRALGLNFGAALVLTTHIAPAAPPTAPPTRPTKPAARTAAISVRRAVLRSGLRVLSTWTDIAREG